MLDALTGRLMRWFVSLGLTPSRWPGTACGTVILEVKGRRSGGLRSLLVTWVEHDGERYLVTMPGQEPQWVKNVRAAGGTVTLLHGSHRDEVYLHEVAASERAPVLQAWYRFTSLSANPRRHFKLGRSAVIEEFERIAADHPVFCIVPVPTRSDRRGGFLMGLRRAVLAAANALTMWAIQAGIPRPPYTRRNAIVVETIGRRSGQPRRVPVGYVEQRGKLMVVVEDGLRAHWVRNALAQGGRLRIHFHGRWRLARLRAVEGDPEAYLRQMNKLHAALVRRHSTVPGVVEIVPE